MKTSTKTASKRRSTAKDDIQVVVNGVYFFNYIDRRDGTPRLCLVKCSGKGRKKNTFSGLCIFDQSEFEQEGKTADNWDLTTFNLIPSSPFEMAASMNHVVTNENGDILAVLKSVDKVELKSKLENCLENEYGVIGEPPIKVPANFYKGSFSIKIDGTEREFYLTPTSIF